MIILFASYSMLRLAPGDPTRSNMFGSEETGSAIDAEKGGLMGNEALRKKLHLDKPIVIGFSLWLKNIVLHNDWGQSASVEPGRDVFDLIL